LQFHNLLKRYLDNEATTEELSIIDTWYELLENENLREISAKELDDIEGRLWHKIQAQTIYKSDISTDKNAKVVSLNWKKYVAAASIVFIVASSIFYYLEPSFHHKTLTDLIPQSGYRVLHNNTHQLMKVSFNDGSTAELNPDATLHYPVLFVGDKREVYLEGEAFFDVAKNPSKPFYVYNNNITTQVIGTSFWIKSNPISKQVDVEVVTGKVAVYENEKLVKIDPLKSNGVIITPNQKVVYNEEQQKLETTIVSKPILVAGATQVELKTALVFDEAPISKVISLLQKLYGIEIVTENENINNCPFTGDISELNMFKQLDLLCKSLGKTYEIKGTKILIKGNGCE
jgi:ferric-dicitrate binding protein FerR (iron transport regulator)